ncbi:MAG: hypothetical protein QOG20_3696 [Pseudonocardiales bacterium]|jgi:hypothetical protein|nr:hypothetical protein [Pseudonocardiales bacterium]
MLPRSGRLDNCSICGREAGRRPFRHPRAEPGCCPLVGLRKPRGIDPQRRHSATAVPQPTGDRADIHAGRDELRGRVVAQVVQVRLDAKPPREPAVALRHRTRHQVLTPVNRRREDERLAAQLEPQRRGAPPAPVPVLRQDRDGLGVERDTSLLVGLGVLLLADRAVLRDRPAQREHACREVHVRPPQRTQLATPRAGRHRQPDQCAPVGVLPRLLDDPGDLLRSRRPRVGPRRRRRRRLRDRVHAYPPPAHALRVGAAEQEVDVADRRGGQRLALVRVAALVAHVFPGRPVVGPPPVGAVRAAAAQLGVEGVQHLGVHPAGLQTPDERPDVLLQVARVHAMGGAADVERLQMAVEQLVEGRVRARVPALVDLVEQPGPRGLGLAGRLRARRDDLHEHVALARDRILTGVDTDAQGAAGQLVDGSALAAAAGLGPCHETTLARFGVT